MIKVSYIAISDDASSFYRAQGVFPFLLSHEVNFEDISDKNLYSWATYIQTDILFIQRPFGQEHINIIELARLSGVKKIILDYDDDVLNIPEHNPAHGLYKQNRQKVMQCIRLVDEVWVSTLGIKKSFDRLNKNIHIIPNAHNDFLYPVVNKKPFNWDNKKVLYRGGHTHYMDIKTVTPLLVRIAKENPSFEFIYMGMLGNEHFYNDNIGNNNVSFTNSVHFMQYMQEIQKLNSPIGICPLNMDMLNIAKSNCSWIEMTYSGSCFFGNKELPEFNLPGILPLSLLDKAISESHVSTMKSRNEESWEYIQENLLLSDVNQERLNRILS